MSLSHMTLEVMNHKLTQQQTYNHHTLMRGHLPSIIPWEDYFHVSESIGRELSRIDKKIKEMENK